jgi:hypothetical protein
MVEAAKSLWATLLNVVDLSKSLWEGLKKLWDVLTVLFGIVKFLSSLLIGSTKRLFSHFYSEHWGKQR